MKLELEELRIIERALHSELSRTIIATEYNEVLKLYSKVFKERREREEKIQRTTEWVNKFKED